MKCNKSGFRPLVCTYRLNWAGRISWGLWDEWNDTAIQTQDSKFKPWRSEAEHPTSRSRRLPTILSFLREDGEETFSKPPRPRNEPRTLAWVAAVLTTTQGPVQSPFKLLNSSSLFTRGHPFYCFMLHLYWIFQDYENELAGYRAAQI